MGFKILEKKSLGNSGIFFEMVLDTPLIARKAHAGNFVIVRINETGERIPLTIADYDRNNKTITIVVQVVGKSTKLLSYQNVGDEILDVVGSLGNRIQIEKLEYPIVVIGETYHLVAAETACGHGLEQIHQALTLHPNIHLTFGG